MDCDEEYQALQSKHLSVFLTDCRSFVSTAVAAAGLLELDFLDDEVKLTDEDKKRFFRMVIDSLTKVSQCMDESRDELQVYVNAHSKWNNQQL